MDLPVWFMLAAVLLAVHADPADQRPQVFDPSSKPSPAPKVHKREPQYEMKEVILYLTPSQIRAVEAGLVHPRELMHTQIHPEPHPTTTAEKATPSINDEIQEQMQNMKNILNDAGQKIQKEVKKMENNKNVRMQQENKEAKANKQIEQLKKITPELNAPQSPQLDLQKREKYINFPLDLQYIPSEQPQSERNIAPTPNLEQHIQHPQVPNFDKLVGEAEFNIGRGHQATHLSLPHFQLQQPQLQHIPLHQGKSQGFPPNYAFLYFYPKGKPEGSDKFQLFAQLQQQEQKKLPQQSDQEPKERKPQESSTQEDNNQRELLSQLEHQEKELHFQVNHRPQEFVFRQDQRPKLFLHAEHKPKEIIYHTNQDLKQLLLHQQHRNQPQILQPEHNIFLHAEQPPKEFIFNEGQKLKPYHIQPGHHAKELISQPEFHPLFHPKFELVPYEYALQNKLEAQQILQTQLYGHEFYPHPLQAQALEPQQAGIDTQNFLNQKELEPQYHPQENLQIELPQSAKTPTLKPDTKVEHLKESDIKEFHPRFQKELEKVMEAQKEQAKLQAQEQEAHRLDSELEEEQEKAEKFKAKQLAEQQQNEKLPSGYLPPPPTSLDILMKMEPKRSQMYSILKPLFQGHNIAESLEEQRASFPHHQIQLEKGFKPLQYAPKFYGEEYAKELEKIEKRNQIAKEQALAKAAAMANAPAEIIKSVEDKAISYEVVKHVQVPVPTPVMVPVPAPFEVKVPQPYAVPLEIFRPVPVPIVKMEKVEVEKPVPIEVEKRVPVPVTRNVYVQVDKPYFVQKVVPVEVKKKIPVEIPIRKPQKLSIIRHVWES